MSKRLSQEEKDLKAKAKAEADAAKAEAKAQAKSGNVKVRFENGVREFTQADADARGVDGPEELANEFVAKNPNARSVVK